MRVENANGRGTWALPAAALESAAPESVSEARCHDLEQRTGLRLAASLLRPLALFELRDDAARTALRMSAFYALLPAGEQTPAIASSAQWLPLDPIALSAAGMNAEQLRVLRAARAVATLEIRDPDAPPPELADHPEAIRACKKPVAVDVVFAPVAGTCVTLEGPVRYLAGDALLRASSGETWPVARARFDQTYKPVPGGRAGEPGAYVKRAIEVLALRLRRPCTVRVGSAGDPIQGAAGDWLIQYSLGDYGIVGASIFDATYIRRGRVLEGVRGSPGP